MTAATVCAICGAIYPSRDIHTCTYDPITDPLPPRSSVRRRQPHHRSPAHPKESRAQMPGVFTSGHSTVARQEEEGDNPVSHNLKQRAMAPAQQGEPTLAQLIERMKPEIGRALPKHMNPDRMARIATTVLRQTPALARCTPESFLGALLTASQLGLEPGPLGEAYLVPYGNTVTFIPGYRGLVKLAFQSGQVQTLQAHVVHENDDFDYCYGLTPDLRHKPTLGDRGKPIAVYAAAVLKDGGSNFEVMSVADVEAIRRRSKASNNGPWKTDWSAMARKTVVKQLAKWLPLSTEFSAAVVRDGTVRTDTQDLVDVQPVYAEGEIVDAPPAIQSDEPADTAAPDEAAPIDRDSLEAAVLVALDTAGVTDVAAHLSGLYGDKLTGVADLTDDELQQLLATTTKEN